MAKQQQKGAAFMAALTATDQLHERDRKAVARDVKDDLWTTYLRTRRLAEQAYHLTAAAAITASLANAANRDRDYAFSTPEERQRTAAAATMIERITAYVGAPGRTRDQINAKLGDLKRFRGAVSGDTEAVALWRAREPDWMAQIEAELAALQSRRVSAGKARA
jgi:hypothetical protein